MEYRPRTVDTELDALFPYIAAIVLDGPKAVGKTTTALKRARTVIRLDDVRARVPVEADPAGVLAMARPLLIDEWQRVPSVWDEVRHAVDSNPEGGQFLLAGSASPYLDAPQHSGAGRIGCLRMRPMTLEERGVVKPTIHLSALLDGARAEVSGECPLTLADYAREITASGFPAIRTLPERARRFQLDSYIRSIVDKDVVEQGVEVRRPEVMLAWLRSYAAATSTTASYSRILDAATPGETDKPAKRTATVYRDVLASLWLLDPVPAWLPTGSTMTRLGRAPKHHLADPALAARLLGASPQALLTGQGLPDPAVPGAGTLLGALFESLVTLCLRVPAQACEAEVCHLRTRNGDHEVDLLLVRPDGRLVAVEVKLAGAIEDRDVKHLRWLEDRLGDRVLDSVVVSTGRFAYRRPDGIAVVPLGLLGL